jgi:hypothetical protein
MFGSPDPQDRNSRVWTEPRHARWDDTSPRAAESNDADRPQRDHLFADETNEEDRSTQGHDSNNGRGESDYADMRKELKDSTAEITQIRHILK